MNSLNSQFKSMRFAAAMLLAVPAQQVFANDDTYIVNEDTLLSVAAPGVLINDPGAVLPPLSGATQVTDVDTANGISPNTDNFTFASPSVATQRPLRMNSDGSFTHDPRGILTSWVAKSC